MFVYCVHKLIVKNLIFERYVNFNLKSNHSMGSFASKSSKPQDNVISSIEFMDKLKKEGHTCVVIEEDRVSWCHQKVCKYRQ